MHAHRLFVLLALVGCIDGSAGAPQGGGDAAPVAPPVPPPVDAAVRDGVSVVTSAHAHTRCAWIEYGNDVGYQDFADHADYFDAIHPDWYAIGTDGTSLVALRGADDSRVLAAARAHYVLVIPMIAGVDNAIYAETMYRSASLRTTHVANLVALAVSHGYDGLDIDYEHLPTSDRTAYTRFIQDLAAAMHAQGKSVSVAAYGTSEDSSIFDYAALAAAADQIHVMGYDYHWLGGSHAGPVAPLGWVEAVAQHAASTGMAAKFILGLPNYGISANTFCRGADCAASCPGGVYLSTNGEMAGCALNWQGFSAGRSPNCMTADGPLYFDDVASLEEKVATARRYGLGGITWWAMGNEIPGLWDMVLAYYPR